MGGGQGDILGLPLYEALYMQCLLHSVYGVDLTTLVKLEGGVIPHILKECIDHIQSRGDERMELRVNICLLQLFSIGLSVEGLYRISGQTSEILQLKEKYDAGNVHTCCVLHCLYTYITA